MWHKDNTKVITSRWDFVNADMHFKSEFSGIIFSQQSSFTAEILEKKFWKIRSLENRYDR